MNLTDLDTFIRVTECGSFTAAARLLGVPKSTVSRRVARLEQQLGLQLLQRTARAFSLTDHGRTLCNRCAPALREIVDVERALVDSAEEPRGRLRVAAPPDLGNTRFFARLLTGFREGFPGVTVEVDLSRRMVDLVEDGFDVALRVHAGPLPDSASLMVRPLFTVTGGIYASQAYVDRRGAPERPEDLREHDCISPQRPDGQARWNLCPRGTRDLTEYDVAPVLVANDYGLIVEQVRAGAGIGLVPTFLAEPSADRAELLPVLTDWTTAEGAVSLVWPASRHLAPRVRAFIDHVVAARGEGPGLPESTPL